MFDEQWMKKSSQDLTLDFFQKIFFSKFELLNSGCSLSAGVAYPWVFAVGGF